MLKFRRWALALAAGVCMGCVNDVATGGAGAGNPPFADVIVTVQANSANPAPLGKTAVALRTNSNGTITLTDSVGTTLTLTSIQAWVLDDEFELPSALICSDTLPDCVPERVLSNQPYVTDFIVHATKTTSGILRVPTGIYGSVGIDLKINGHFPGQDSSVYSGFQNLLLFGHLGAEDSVGKPFVFRQAISDSVDFQTTDSVEIRAGMLNQVVLPVNVDDWFQNVNMKKCVEAAGEPVDADGNVELRGDTACAGTGLKVRMNVEASGAVDIDD